MQLTARERGLLVCAILLGARGIAAAQVPLVPDLHQLRPDRSVEAVVLTGASFPQWSAGPEITLRRPQVVQPTPLNPSDCASLRPAATPSSEKS